MPILSPIGRRSLRMRLLISGIYMFLIAGAVTMVYPFLLMISGSTKSAVDLHPHEAIPAFVNNDLALYRKHIEGLFNERVTAMNQCYAEPRTSFQQVEFPEASPLLPDWHTWLNEFGDRPETFTIGGLWTPVSKTFSRHLRGFRDALQAKYGKRVSRVNEELNTEFVNWNAFLVLPANYLARRNKRLVSPFARELESYQAKVPRGERTYFVIEAWYKSQFLQTQYGKDVQSYNQTHETAYTDWPQIRLTRRYPANGTAKERDNWEQCVRFSLNLLWIRADAAAQPSWAEMLEAKYQDISELNRRYDARYSDFASVPLPDPLRIESIRFTDWNAFLEGWKDATGGRIITAPIESLYLTGPDFEFQDWLEDKYRSIDELNRSLGTQFTAWNEIAPPQAALHHEWFKQNRASIRNEFLTRNYITVFDYLIRQGRGILNTVIYCLLAVLTALIVNPLAAYALSRYRPASTYKILMFLLLTMAFPPMVTQIPVFLMLRDFDLLNTFAALVLPGLAHGYSIFLLKGFFDSLPRELYESAEIDGAGEWTMFWNITMSLSKPVLAVIALSAFTAAYSNFMFALLICQDESMWTLMVWLYQLADRAGQPVMYASLILAAIPTFLIFVFCQNIIMRGIVIPVEK